MFLELALHLVLKKCQILASTKEAQPSLPLLGPLGSSAKARWSVMGLWLSGFLPTLQHVCLKKLQILPGIQSDLKHLRFPELIRPAMQGGNGMGPVGDSSVSAVVMNACILTFYSVPVASRLQAC